MPYQEGMSRGASECSVTDRPYTGQMQDSERPALRELSSRRR